MYDIDFYLDNKPSQPAVNADGFEIELNYDTDAVNENGGAKLSTTIQRVTFALEEADEIMEHFYAGKSYVGKPFRFEIRKNNIKYTPFDGYVDLTEQPEFDDRGQTVTVTVKEKKRLDWLDVKAELILYRLLAEDERFKQDIKDSTILMPYVISTLPNYKDAAIFLVALPAIVIQIVNSIQEIIHDCQHSLWILGEWTHIITLIIRVVVLIIQILEFILLVLQLIRLIIQPVKYHACMYVKDLLRIGAKAMDYTLETDFTDGEFEQLVYFPTKSHVDSTTSGGEPTTSRGDASSLWSSAIPILGYLNPTFDNQPGWPDATFADALRQLKKVMRYKITPTSDNRLILKREDKSTGTAQYQLPDRYQPKFTTNANELKANRVFSFQADFNDKNTIQHYFGNKVQIITSDNLGTPEDLNLLKHLTEETFDFARGIRKTEITTPENIAGDLIVGLEIALAGPIIAYNGFIAPIKLAAEGLGAIVDVLNFVFDLTIPEPPQPDFIDPFDTIPNEDYRDRIGMLLLENDHVAIPKLFLVKKGSKSSLNRIPANNDDVVSAKNLWIKRIGPVLSFAPSAERPFGAQCIKKEYTGIDFGLEDEVKIKDNNAIFTADNQEAFFVDGKWNPRHEIANARVRIPYLHTPTITERIIEPNGT